MNIGERFFCSKCLMGLEDETVCPYCGYDPVSEEDGIGLEEGTYLHGMRYQLGAVIGQGGFGITYAAWDLTLDMPVAVKEYYPRGFCERNVEETDIVTVRKDYRVNYQIGLRTFIREACILASLQNIQSVVRVYDCFEENRTSYIVMEFVRGKNLADYCTEHKVPPKRLLQMLRGIIQDLVQVHHAGVVHRDISPYNLLVQEDGSVRLIDFGASTGIGEEGRAVVSLNRHFAAPEQFDPDAKQGFGLDVYAMSATIYTLLTGQLPQNALSRLEKDTLKKPRKLNRHISRRVSDSLFEAMRLEPQKRTRSMEELQADLYHAVRPLRTRKQKILFAVKIAVMMLLFQCLESGIQVFHRENYGRQIELAARAVLGHDLNAACTLAFHYQNGLRGGERIQENSKLAEYWYRWASNHGSAEAAVNYGTMLQQSGSEENKLEAIRYYRQAADAGDAVALNNLGIAYLNGDSVPQDIPAAIQYFERSAEAGSSKALVNLGNAYCDGIGIEENPDAAFACFRKAAEQGDAEGLYFLACCYWNGTGTEPDTLQSIRCLYEAADAGLGIAMFDLGELYRTGELGFCDYKKAKEWYTRALRADFSGGFYGIGILYRDGLGVEQDLDKAYINLLTALTLHFEPAKEELEKMTAAGYQYQPEP